MVLSLIFLKFISDKFEVRKNAIVAAYGNEYVDMVYFYTMENVFYPPEYALVGHLFKLTLSKMISPLKLTQPYIQLKRIIKHSPVHCQITTSHDWV
ncbi:MAG: hypothetical protein RPR97_10105 [Colwellia sp.]